VNSIDMKLVLLPLEKMVLQCGVKFMFVKSTYLTHLTKLLRTPLGVRERHKCIGLKYSTNFKAKMSFEDLNLSSVELV
jgi:hypothetical protein